LGCENRPLEDTTEIDVTVAVDDKKPQVTCNIGAQDLYGSGGFRNLDFSFTAVDEDECTDTDDLAVTIEVLSNEAVAFKNEMVLISEPLETTGNILSIWVEDAYCFNTNNFREEINERCQINSAIKTRVYIVRVTATDKAGNVGVGECSTIVGAEEDREQTQVENVPAFLIAKLDIVGGVAPGDVPLISGGSKLTAAAADDTGYDAKGSIFN